MSTTARIDDNNSLKKISHIQFGLLSNPEIERIAQLEICSRELFKMPDRSPAPFGCLDTRLGISNKQISCGTCGKNLLDCAGHFGFVNLKLPVFHFGYLKHIINILQCICKQCSSILLPPEQKVVMLQKAIKPNSDSFMKARLFAKLLVQCKKAKSCFNPECGTFNGKIRKLAGATGLKIIHERFKDSEEKETIYDELRSACAYTKELKNYIDNIQEDLSPTRVLQLFQQITDEDCLILWMEPSISRPENMIVKSIPVPPVAIRPSVAMESGGGSNEDDITVKLQEIIDVNNALGTALSKGATISHIMEMWGFLQLQVAQIINGDLPGIPKLPSSGHKAIRGFCQRLKGKTGRFRGNLSGKRVDFSGRTVISPDPNLGIDEVGVPVQVAKIMTFPERVNQHNIELLKQRILNGPHNHPGANIYRQSGTGFTKNLNFANRATIAAQLKCGDIVERHMQDGDIVLFNRQPSLHRLSIMAHRAKVMPWRTFRFNECVCAPYNADFDGDEMNLHLPQTYEARTEAMLLMAVSKNLVTPRNGENIIAATQDFLTGAYLLSSKDVFYDRETFCQLVAYLSDAKEQIDLPSPTILKPIPMWTGKQVISLLVRPVQFSPSEDNILINLEVKEKCYSEGLHFCPNDGFICFRNSELISGNLGKKVLGNGSKSGLFFTLLHTHGSYHATRCMNRLAKLTSRFLGGHRGFSIGIDDVTPSPSMVELKSEILSKGYTEAEQQISNYKQGKMALRPGCDDLQSLEAELNGILGQIREAAGKQATKILPWANSPRIMAECGSKGSPLNISQMIACVGQQAVGGQRIQNGFVNRTLPHFLKNELSPAAKGFVANSFYSGLTATEFFFHTMGGREGLVDTAVKTAETGYMARRLMKALEDLTLHYDNTVRNSEMAIVQFIYGDDGLYPGSMEGDDRPVEFDRLRAHVQATIKTSEFMATNFKYKNPINISNEEYRPLTPSEIQEIGKNAIQSAKFQALLPQGEKFLQEITNFCENAAKQIESFRTKLNISHVSSEQNVNDLSSIVGSYEWRANKRNAPKEEVHAWMKQAGEKDSKAWLESSELVVQNISCLTKAQLETLISTAYKKYKAAHVEPGEAVGAVGAQSIGEPGTQMTLKTFHFAGVASMNVTLGVPRLKEIINASKIISTPIITAQLLQKENLISARIAKAKIEKTTLGQIIQYIEEVHTKNLSYLVVKLDFNCIKRLYLNVNGEIVRQAIIKGNIGTARSPIPLRKLKPDLVSFKDGKDDQIMIIPPESSTKSEMCTTYFMMQELKGCLPSVIVTGIPTALRAVINKEEIKGGHENYHLLVEGSGLLQVMGTPGIDGCNTRSNHIIEVLSVLGIEAARSSIISEISYIMQAYGISIDQRHLMLLADVMTFKGEILGITRFGVAKMRESVLMLASFEKTTDHLFDAAVHSRSDVIVGVSECIILGIPVPLGTGMFKLLHAATRPTITKKIPLLQSSRSQLKS